jgi:hypothetical protein
MLLPVSVEPPESVLRSRVASTVQAVARRRTTGSNLRSMTILEGL